ncbi:hypothetical protein RyT2_09490 [Pseudolactococcus yaeyamensis]
MKSDEEHTQFELELDRNGIHDEKITELLNRKVIFLKDVIEVMNIVSLELKHKMFLKCDIILGNLSNDKSVLSLDTVSVEQDWDNPYLKISKYIVWHERQNEKILTTSFLREGLILVYCEKSNNDFYISIMSKEVYFRNRISDAVSQILFDISVGDFDLIQSINQNGEKFTKQVVDFLLEHNYVFAIEKEEAHGIETIVMQEKISFEKMENQSIEFSSKGRVFYFDNRLSVQLTRFLF